MKNTIKVGAIGFGHRGLGQTKRLVEMEDVEILWLCDLYEDRMQETCDAVVAAGRPAPKLTANYHDILKDESIDAVFCFTAWESHVQICIDCMKAGKYVATEVGGACNLDSLFRLVETHEQTGVPCMMLENCCYGRPEMTVLNMVKKGLFGELIHAEGGYRHDLRDEVSQGIENRHYRYRNYKHRNGELYPTHELGPIAKWLNINRGNRFVSLVSVASKSRGIPVWAKEHLPEGHSAREPFVCGDVVTTIITTALGETITLYHDTSLPRPYSRANVLQGTKGIYSEDCKGYYLDGVEPEAWSPMDDMYEKYEHPIWRRYRAEGVKAGHGGMDYLTLRAFVEAVKNGTDTPIDVYDTASWMAVTCLSEASVAMGGAPVDFPDFTGGKWLIREAPVPSEYSLDYIPDIEIPETESEEKSEEKSE